jgi:hypothetical protein
MNVRNKARKLARKDPALARELRIGRPDLPWRRRRAAAVLDQ